MEEKKLNIELTPDVASGTYSNFAIISHTSTEFLLDFAQMLPEQQGKAVVRNRIFLHPEHAKRLLAALSDNIRRYEQQFGPINQSQPKAANSTINLGDFLNGNGNGSKS